MKNKKLREIIKMFIREKNLPISIFEQDFFEEKLDLYDKKAEFELFYSKAISLCEKLDFPIEELSDRLFSFKNDVINNIKNNSDYKKYQNFKISKNSKLEIKKGDIYKEQYLDKKYISIDLKKANFISLAFLRKDGINLLGNAWRYSEFIKGIDCDFGDFILDSKVSRQFIFGNLNPKKQNQIQKEIMLDLSEIILKEMMISISRIISINSDEVIIEFKDDEDLKRMKQIIHRVEQKLQIESKIVDTIIEVDIFKLKKIKEFNCFVKIPNNKEIKLENIKYINKNLIPIFMRYLKEENIIENDLIFFYEKRKCLFLDYPKIDYNIKNFLLK